MTSTSLKMIDFYVQVSVLPFIIVFGIIGNIFNIYIVTRPSLRRSCSIYLLAGSINGLILLLFGSSSRWIGATFDHLDATKHSTFFCRFRSFITSILYTLAPYFIACATIDRYCSSSTEARIRRWSSSTKFAYRIIALIVSITTIANVHILIFYNIINTTCTPQFGFYSRFYPFFATIYYFTAVIIIIIFGIGTIRNIRSQKKRIQSITSGNTQVDRRRTRNDGQILIMLFVHVICYLCFALPYHYTLIFASIQPSLNTNQLFISIRNLGIVVLNFNQAVSVGLRKSIRGVADNRS